VSVPRIAEGRLSQLECEGICVLNVSRHGNKLRPGHLHGNRFTVLIREAGNPQAITPIIEHVKANGLPNYYGTQRFGRDAETLRIGWTLLHGGRVQAGRFLRKLAFSAVQSACFNVSVSQRLQAGLLRTVLPGDVMVKWPAGGMFVTHDAQSEQLRFDQREIMHTGPMFGSKMRQPAEAALQREAGLLEQLGLAHDAFQAGGKLLEGTRRMNLVYVDDLQFSEEPAGLRLQFSLPAGSYATTLLAEIMKSAVPVDGD
jgi:tRNA pseudouridine13 synthase